MITAIIPVVNPELADQLLKSLSKGTVTPDLTVIIDNTINGYSPVHTGLNLLLSRESIPLGVNASWMKGFSLCPPATTLVSVLNDDIIVWPNFYEEILHAFRYKNCVCVCPHTTSGKQKFESFPLQVVLPMEKREGWAFTIRKEIIDAMPPIPAELDTFCGDDWIWNHSTRNGGIWYKTTRTTIYHYVGVSVKAKNKLLSLRGEKSIFRRLMK